MKVGVIMGSGSDWDVMQPAVSTLQEFGIEVEKRVRFWLLAFLLICKTARLR